MQLASGSATNWYPDKTLLGTKNLWIYMNTGCLDFWDVFSWAWWLPLHSTVEVCVCLCVYAHACECANKSVWVGVCLHIHACVCVSMHECMCVCLCMCVCASSAAGPGRSSGPRRQGQMVQSQEQMLTARTLSQLHCTELKIVVYYNHLLYNGEPELVVV